MTEQAYGVLQHVERRPVLGDTMYRVVFHLSGGALSEAGSALVSHAQIYDDPRPGHRVRITYEGPTITQISRAG